MPYINDEMQGRDQLSLRVDEVINCLRYSFEPEELEGACNYTISRIVAGAMKPETGWRYKWLNRAYGTFVAAAAEFYRRLVAPYEDRCIEKNGDIPEYVKKTTS